MRKAIADKGARVLTTFPLAKRATPLDHVHTHHPPGLIVSFYAMVEKYHHVTRHLKKVTQPYE